MSNAHPVLIDRALQQPSLGEFCHVVTSDKDPEVLIVRCRVAFALVVDVRDGSPQPNALNGKSVGCSHQTF